MACRKCGKAYVAQRKTKLYCNENCRSAYNQQVKRGTAFANPLSATEAYLLETVLQVTDLARSIWTEMRTGVERMSIANIENLGRCEAVARSERMQQLKGRYEETKQLAAMKKRSGKHKPRGESKDVKSS